MIYRIGSLFSGYGGLELGVSKVVCSTVAWHCEVEPAPSKVLAHHWPDVPNLGDITAVDWDRVEPVDILCGGFPCQDLSHAGKQAGLGAGTRSGLWSHMATAIDKLRPRLVVAENVRGILSARADSDLESCEWCVGPRRRGEHRLRALGAVLGDLADIGYDAGWVGLRAADAGSCHGRFRVFIVATAADSDRTGGVEAVEHDGGVSAEANRAGVPDQPDSQPDGVGPQRDVALLPTPTATPYGNNQSDSPGAAVRPSLDSLARLDLLPTPTATDAKASGGGYNGQNNVTLTGATARGRVDFGQYAPAIARWEAVLGRPAPSPTQPGRTGKPQLAAPFVEWMMGLDPGHVTDPAIGLSRSQQLRCLGNGVVPQQAALALRLLKQMGAW